MTFFAIMSLMFFFTSCEEKIENEKPEKVDVEFVLNNPGLDNPGATMLKGGTLKAGGNTGIPQCVDSAAVSVHVVGTGPDGVQIDMVLPLLNTYDDGKQTVLVKMTPGDYKITQFEVLAEGGSIIYASPLENSYYDNLFDFTNNVEVDFTLLPFNKQKINVDVLCWQDYKYKEFGYFWFDYHNYAIKTVCFFGDVCTKFFDEWSTWNNSPYANLTVQGYDFPALFSVIVVNENDPEHVTVASNFGENMTTDNIGEPVCVEYLDNLEVENEHYLAQLYLELPDGSQVMLDEIEFTDADWSETDDASTWGGDDAIWEFAVGSCAMAAHADDIDGVYNIPWVPLPNTLTFKVLYDASAEKCIATDTYFGLGNIQPDIEVGEFVQGDTLGAWCGNKEWHITPGTTYDAYVYPYFNIPSTAPQRYQDITSEQWAMLNYIVNEELAGSYNEHNVQQAIWRILGYVTSGGGAVYTHALNHTTYVPPLGGYIVVLVDPYQVHGTTDVSCREDIQLALVRFDP